jgi:hypothetical protein
MTEYVRAVAACSDERARNAALDVLQQFTQDAPATDLDVYQPLSALKPLLPVSSTSAAPLRWSHLDKALAIETNVARKLPSAQPAFIDAFGGVVETMCQSPPPNYGFQFLQRVTVQIVDFGLPGVQRLAGALRRVRAEYRWVLIQAIRGGWSKGITGADAKTVLVLKANLRMVGLIALGEFDANPSPEGCSDRSYALLLFGLAAPLTTKDIPRLQAIADEPRYKHGFDQCGQGDAAQVVADIRAASPR